MITIVALVSIGALVGLSLGSSYALTVDDKTPDIEIKSGTIWLPSDILCVPGTVSGDENIVVNVTHDGCYKLYIDGVALSEVNPFAARCPNCFVCLFKWDTTKYANGLHEIKVVGPQDEVVDSVIAYVKNDDLVIPPAQNEPIILHPTDDTAISMKATGDTYGSYNSITTRNRYGSPTHPYYWEHDILIRFDLSNIPTGTSIVSAKLYLYYFSYGDNNPANRSLTIHRITSDWNEKTVTWNTTPSYDSMISASAIVPFAPGNWMSWDVTSDAQKFLKREKSNCGWQIMDEVSWGAFNIPCTNFYSKENGALIPYLEIIT